MGNGNRCGDFQVGSPSRRRLLGVVLALVIGLGSAFAAPADEIEALLKCVAGLEGAAFIRNGSTHTPVEAEAHLRLKWSRQKDAIKTAEDFIRLCGTKSSTSGESYRIKFADGHEEPCAKVLTDRLAALRKP